MSNDLPDDLENDASPQLFWAEDGSPRSGRFGDVYFSKDDGLAETRAVFLDGCGLPGAWSDRADFTVAELGFGTGLNIVALLDLWRRARPENGRLHVFSIEGFPLTRDEAARALSAWPDLAETATALLNVWPAGPPGFHRLDLPQWGAVIDLAVGDAEWALNQWSGAADAWFLDGFSPALNPGMWSPEIMSLIAARSAPGARVATFTVAGAVRRGLAEHGFVVEKKPGHGRKRERLEARLPSASLAAKSPPHVAVIGAGVAGASATRALIAGGARVTVIEAERPGAGGSGFPAALVTPRLDAGDALIAGFHAQALERARDLYRALPEAVIAEGVLQLEQTPRDATRFDKIAVQDLWPAETMTRQAPEAVSERMDEAVSTGGLMMSGALALRPSAVLEPWLTGAERLTARVADIQAQDTGWRLLDAQGDVILEVEAVILTAGWGAAPLAPDLPLTPVAGQADWVDGPGIAPVAWGGYAVPTGKGLLFGATHDRGQTDLSTDAEASARNLAALTAALPRLASQVAATGASQSRKAVRATTPDRLPVAGSLGQAGLYALTGLGSRGFCVAPLLGEHLAALILKQPSPLPERFGQRLKATRF
ncbi:MULTISPECIES: FAD-dependent 5-carboxymethylaminomethyl-2-thiouridine(34) oxidoreductase MnmC [unclassified Brevundimonas]|uniref:FAD-dependent 5-carboxymethylaminomethyl-2-thiouridine(34) oxidoreductase MnmC n=1 Tax=unclassified Brevundimonas TaxID=2622653 RepID=UPI000CFCDA64|nr:MULTISPECIES: FAD-dependent 5-carboxymethylaminomethyl-2-thiouridine(34) oxidoreductase MnmC [unclassified Brevundimonas]PRA31746.1 FAD-dependent cmnm(5)s(2)U34 oxidoreductase [Brevundimonas sp. MYb27]PQZ83619.1 FAD-dependent cmnm(5)s(2)U34 oxidoreductase [Brevundimonas sp. MYb31]PRB15793.1 FAD-dependent cmnm(5)s(2)U34 oxidoreductase [Brevundimonas sp. MYb52]PRB36289.1 FAD-dependent cmnm(5)s(2)U34 oxidoreductase [Brevundimonas sp. MYb46]PRB46983.1 FAD-dependent cmnm(5)s(2)U34 oxidoreductase